MEALAVAQRYFDAWNRRDSDAIVAAFAEGGTYRDPTVPDGLSGPAIGVYARGLFEAFPDLSFEIVTAGTTNGGTVVAQWIMRGTNTGPMQGNPPTGGKVAVPGADFIEVADGRVRSVTGYFDQKVFIEQLGLQAIVLPYTSGPVTFGYCAHMQVGKRTKPGAFSLTVIQVRSKEEEKEVVDFTRRMYQDLARMTGFISMVAAVAGNRMFTVTAWEDPESPRQLLRGGAHKEAMERFFGDTLGESGMTSVWVPERINALRVRCTSCGKMADYHRSEGRCGCGATLPLQPPYW